MSLPGPSSSTGIPVIKNKQTHDPSEEELRGGINAMKCVRVTGSAKQDAIAVKRQERLDNLRRVTADAELDWKEIGELREIVKRLESENEGLRAAANDIQIMKDDSTKYQEIVQGQQAELQHAHKVIADLTIKLERSTTQAETRRVKLEPEGAEVFIIKADALAESDVMKMVNELNDEIFQVAAALAEEELDRRHPTKEVFQEAFTWVFNTLSKPLADALHFDFGGDNVFILQSGLQCCMAHFAQHLSCTWRADNQGVDEHFAGLYQRIRDREAQPVAGRWRSLTRANIYTTRTHADAMKKFNTAMTDGLVRVMVVAGYRLNLSRDVLSKYQKRFDLIAQSIFNLNTAMGVQLTSADFSLTHTPSGRPFDPVQMEDVDEPSTRKRSRVTVCTTALGLGKIEGQPTPRKIVLVKPKVVTDALLQELG